MSERRVRVLWTRPAAEALRKIPKRFRKTILEKTRALGGEGVDPRRAHKPLTGPLANHYSIKVSRYRAVYTVREQTLASGDVIVEVTVVVVAVGMRKEGDKQDIYNLARKLIRLGGLAGTSEGDAPAD